MAKLPRLKDRKIKTPTAVALIVFVGVEVKGASHELACWRFFRNVWQINIPRASKYSGPHFPFILKRSG